MLNARYLANLSDDMVELYSQLEFEIQKDIFKRLNKLQKVTDSSVYQIEVLQQVGGLKKDVQKLVAEYDVKARKQLLELYNQAMEKAFKNDLKYSQVSRRELSENQKQAIQTALDRFKDSETINKTFDWQSKKFQEIYESLVRMTLTVADATEKAFLREVNNAYMKVSSGAFSWDNAYRTAVKNLAEDGVKTVLYTGSGKIIERSIESATRMNVLTGINQSATQQTLENADTLGTSLVEVSAHIGARPEHEEWQGQVFSLKDGGESYIDENGQVQFAKNFDKTCRLGEPDGICGINCRHSFYPYFAGFLDEDGELHKGIPTEYSKGELDEMKEQTVTLDGKQVSPYQAEQELRLCERAIRKCKSEIVGLEECGFDATKEKERLYFWQNRARQVTEETGIQRKYINEYIGVKSGNQPRGIKPKTNIVPPAPTQTTTTPAKTVSEVSKPEPKETEIVVFSQNEKQAVEHYVSGEGMWINQYFRNGELELNESEKLFVKDLDNATRHEIGKEMTLYRSVDAKAVFNNITDQEYNALKNTLVYNDKQKYYVDLSNSAKSKLKSTYFEKGFMSTTTDLSIAEDWGDFTGAENPVVLKIKAPKETKGVLIKDLSKDLESEMGQKELLLSRNQKGIIKKLYAKDGLIFIDVEL